MSGSASAKSNVSLFEGYREYVSKLDRMIFEDVKEEGWSAKVEGALNGQASLELQRIIPLESRRKYGTFFTGTDLSDLLIGYFKNLNHDSVIYDPACGMGNLLLSVAKKLPLEKSIDATIKRWGQQLYGTDLHLEFIEGVKARLVLLAQHRHGVNANIRAYKSLFPNIRIGDGLRQKVAYEKATHIVLNPPFGVEKFEGLKWAQGKITAAAVFVIRALEMIKKETEVAAILPEVLRAGAFSNGWRKEVEKYSNIKNVLSYGIFDDSADVDVFRMHAIKASDSVRRIDYDWLGVQESSKILADHFNVHVGRVVPHRDPEKGKTYPYIHARCIPAWESVHEFSETRKFSGGVYQSPFIAIRRTSRPGHPYRALATIINGKGEVAVENHLIVCLPKNGTLKACKALMAQLKTEKVNDFLDKRIRCRHLTVGAVKSIPFEMG